MDPVRQQRNLCFSACRPSCRSNGAPTKRKAHASRGRRIRELFQLRVLCLGSDLDRNIGVSVFPEHEEILIGRLGSGRFSLQRQRTCKSKMCERTRSAILYQTAAINDLLELRCRRGTLTGGQVRLSANVNRIHAGIVRLLNSGAQFEWNCGLQNLDRGRRGLLWIAICPRIVGSQTDCVSVFRRNRLFRSSAIACARDASPINASANPASLTASRLPEVVVLPSKTGHLI
jgi:hypothetical protein